MCVSHRLQITVDLRADYTTCTIEGDRISIMATTSAPKLRKIEFRPDFSFGKQSFGQATATAETDKINFGRSLACTILFIAYGTVYDDLTTRQRPIARIVFCECV